jgi:S-adenosylmethionine:tRNA ribosyltransferase-isomerase
MSGELDIGQLGTDLTLRDFDFELPAELIAQEPLSSRDESRLLAVDRMERSLTERRFRDFPGLLDEGDLVVFNDTRVLKSRLLGLRERTSGKAEILVLGSNGAGRLTVLLKARGTPEPGERFVFADGELPTTLLRRVVQGIAILESGLDDAALAALFEAKGAVPLPPYIRRKSADPRTALDVERYQTIYARVPGAVAAPTAGLHFTARTLADLEARGVRRASITLAVGLGTFKPIETEDFRSHRMHEETFTVPEETARLVGDTRAKGRRIVAVGTTTVRALESAAATGVVVPMSGATRAFIHPPYRFKVVDALLTNFHMPRTSLVLLVSAFAGRELLLSAYAEAVRRRFRLLSYGDAMFIH